MAHARTTFRAVAAAALALVLACVSPAWADRAAEGPSTGQSDSAVEFGPVAIQFDGRPAPEPSRATCGLSVVAPFDGPQLALTEAPPSATVSLSSGKRVAISRSVRKAAGAGQLVARVTHLAGPPVRVAVEIDGHRVVEQTLDTGSRELRASLSEEAAACLAALVSEAIPQPAASDTAPAVHWDDLRFELADGPIPFPVFIAGPEQFPPPSICRLDRAIEQALIEWDWRMQDGIGTPRKAVGYRQAVAELINRGGLLLDDLQQQGVDVQAERTEWEQLAKRAEQLRQAEQVPQEIWESLWRSVHQLRRQTAFRNPLFPRGPLAFVKHVPSAFSHQLTQYDGRNARPGGGVFLLEEPGRSMNCRQLAAGKLPVGAYEHLDVSYDARRLLFAFCEVDKVPPTRDAHPHVFFHLYEATIGEERVRQITDGPFDDFSPRYLPDGRIVFLSTRRGGFHRCGRGPCPVYTLAVVGADGASPHPISYHETHEWDPVVLNDGSILYTRWDYVDRHAVHYQQLWCVRPDGTNVRAYYGNNTLNPVGVWEARPVPGSRRVMATAGAHHAMTAGSIILLDILRGQDGLRPIERLTPDALFPESEVPVVRQTGGWWHAPVGVTEPPPASEQAERWPGHCYRTPHPLSEDYFLAAYSFDRLIGEPTANPVNMFGIYWVDRFGNKELLYRDPNISSLWPAPLVPRSKPPVVASVSRPLAPSMPTHMPAAGSLEGPPGPASLCSATGSPQGSGTVVAALVPEAIPTAVGKVPDAKPAISHRRSQGTFLLYNVYDGWPQLPPGGIKRLRVVQVLPKSTPHINDPPVGIPNASPGKQVLGTVPVEDDGSAFFTAPAGVPLAFQALDQLGQAVQMMRSVTYLQPGESTGCIGCHEPRNTSPPAAAPPLALRRDPSPITPGPEGCNPLSYPLLVQPVLDRQCVRCHNPQKPDGNLVLTGDPEGHYTVSYNALASRVSFSAWGGKPGDFRKLNSEPMTRPGFFGARGSSLMQLLLAGHEGVQLDPQEVERLATWMDANALFYGTFDPEDQRRQQRGQQIAGPAVE